MTLRIFTYFSLLIYSFHHFTVLKQPILLQGHERAITQVKYNSDGDLLFTTAKDQKPTVWYSDTGERLGTYG